MLLVKCIYVPFLNKMYLLTYLKNQGVYKYDLTTPACTLRLSLHRYPMDGQNDKIHNQHPHG